MLGPGFILCCEGNPPLCRGVHINACGALESRIPETLIVLHAATSGGKHSPVLHSVSLFRCFILQHLEENILQSYTLSISFVVSYCNIWRKTFSSLTLSLSLSLFHTATSGGKHSPVLHSLSLFRCFILQHLEENILQSYTLSISFVVSYCNIWRKTFSSLTLSLSLSLFHTATSGGKHSPVLHSLSLFRCFILQHLEENILQSYTLSLSFVVSYCNIWRKTFSSLTLCLSLSLFHTATSGGKHSPVLHSLSLFCCFILQHLEENILQSYTLSLSFVVSYCNIWRKTFSSLTLCLSLSLFHTATSGGKHSMILHLSVSSLHTATSGGKHSSSLSCLFHSPSQPVSSCFQI